MCGYLSPLPQIHTLNPQLGPSKLPDGSHRNYDGQADNVRGHRSSVPIVSPFKTKFEFGAFPPFRQFSIDIYKILRLYRGNTREIPDLYPSDTKAHML
jgi:hypothetical protein